MALKVGELYGTVSLNSKQFDKGINETKGKLKKFGGVAGGIMAGAVAAIGAAVLGGVKFVGGFNDALVGMQQKTGATDDQMKKFGKSLKSIYAANYGKGFADIADVMSQIRQTTGKSGEALKDLTKGALQLRDVFGHDVQKSVEATDQLMKQFGISGQEAMTLIAQGTQKGLDKSGDLLDTINEYSVFFKQAGLGAEEMFNIFENASKAGIRNLDYVGDAFKEMIIRTKDGSAQTKEAFSSLGLNAQKMAGMLAAGGDKATAAFQKTMKALSGIKDPIKKNRIGVQIFGTKFEDLEAKAVAAMGNIDGSMDKSADTLKDINKIKYKSFGKAMQGIKRQLKVSILMPIGKAVLPLLNKFASFLKKSMPAIKSAISAAFGTIGKIFGLFTQSVKNNKSTFSTWGNRIKIILTAIGRAFIALKPIFMIILQFAGKLLKQVWALLKWFGNLIWPFIQQIITKIRIFWKKNGAQIMAAVKNVFNIILGIIKFVMPLIKTIIKVAWNIIKGIFSAALKIIMGIIKFFAGLFTGDFSKMWEGIKDIFGGAIDFVVGLVKGLFHAVGAIFKSIWGLAKKIFGWLWGGIKKGAEKFKDAFLGIWNGIKNGIRAVINPIIGFINGMLGGLEDMINSIGDAINNIPSISIPDWVPGIGGKSFGLPYIPNISVPRIPRLATGGIAVKSTLANIGEAGDEAVIPLQGRRMKPFAQAIAEQINVVAGNVGKQAPIIVQIGEYEFIKATSDPMDRSFEKRNTYKRRANGYA